MLTNLHVAARDAAVVGWVRCGVDVAEQSRELARPVGVKEA